MSNPTITVTASTAQYAALRKLSLKYTDVSVQQMAEKLFRQVIRNYYKTEAKQIASKAGAQWDAATKLGFDTNLSRAEYVSRATKEAKQILRELNGVSLDVFDMETDEEETDGDNA